MFSPKLTNAGKPNPAYDSIEKVMKEYVSIAAAGGEAGADRVRISGATIKMNEYYNGQGQHMCHPRVNASFVNKVTGEFRPRAEWEMEFAISSIDFVVDDDGVEVEPKKLRVKTLVPQYGGKIDTVEFVAVNPGVIDAITSYWENGKLTPLKAV